MEMPKGWKRLCDDIPYIEDKKTEKVKLDNDEQWFLWNTADLIKEMAEALELSKQYLPTMHNENNAYIKICTALKNFKEWK